MGNRASSQLESRGGTGSFCWQTTVNIIHSDGRLEQLKEKMKAEHFLSQNPNCFMCCSESMFVGSLIPRVDPSEELQLDHIYFLMPLSKSHVPLSLEDLCKLAIKAHAALAHSRPQLSVLKSSFSQTNCLRHPLSPKGIPIQFLGLC
ncbi:hypothetical protein L6164_031954 [Bauhinia variegata]|uniref:Uncharacterized protein n=1 Tax=Bauhinia variegata TaxID=167791 RepID=A0ACB9KMB4_BAUVA|nr:hypothetical protein L6164_031954 [Bauhinia variegata]